MQVQRITPGVSLSVSGLFLLLQWMMLSSYSIINSDRVSASCSFQESLFVCFSVHRALLQYVGLMVTHIVVNVS